MIRLLDENADLLVSQSTWSVLQTMLRVYKLHDLAFRLDPPQLPLSPDAHAVPHTIPRVPAVRVAFSSYYGKLNSADDFYISSARLVIQETTIGCSDPATSRRHVTPHSVLEWLRNIVANRLAYDATSWSGWFQMYNSGTYNNQWMVVDLNKFKPGESVPHNTVHFVEQAPGQVRVNDMSRLLEMQRYIGSYNTAYDPLIRNICGWNTAADEYGRWFEYNTTARAAIMQRYHDNITDIPSMKRFMRYNDFVHDELSSQLPTCQHKGWTNCTPWYTAENTIATRGDLQPHGVYVLPSFGPRNHAQTDAKITAASMFDKANSSLLKAWAVAGPSAEQQPVFCWSSSVYENVPHLGHVDCFNFSWVEIMFQ